LIIGFERDFGQYLIHRLQCKSTGLTISMHPVFTHKYKRYLLSFVIESLLRLIRDSDSFHSVSSTTGVCRRTLRRWREGFTSNETAKRSCFFRGGLSPPGIDFGTLLLSYFRKNDAFNTASGAARGMLRLEHEYSCSLY